LEFEVPGTLGVIYNYKKWKEYKKGYPFLTINDYLDEEEISEKLNIVYVCLSDLCEELFAKLKTDTTAVLMIDTYNENGLAEQRKLFTELMNNGIKTPVIIGRAYGDLSEEQLQLSASSDLGAVLLDGLGD
jgi:(E)-4-hydroxy-3-methylbut-2-enyl-diphosphate synthase